MLNSGVYSLRDKVSNLSDFPVLMAATHADASPTPPHLSQRVVSISFVSRQKCVHLMEHLLDIAQAASKSLHSRIKAVRLLQELVTKGDPEFQPLLQKEEHKLKAVASFLDPQAPLDSARLREATAVLLEVLFEETSRPLPLSAPLSGPASALAAPSYQRTQYQGFGNPHFVQNRSSSSSGIISLVSEKVSDLLSTVPPPDPNRFSSREYPGRLAEPLASSGYAQNSCFHSGATRSHSASLETRLPESFPHSPGTPGAEWDLSTAAAPEPRSNGAPERAEAGQLERQLVAAFTAEGGVRSRPSRQELEEFAVRCRALDCCLLAELLCSLLGPEGTGSKLKSLFALEALYRSFPAQTGDVIAAHAEAISCLAAKGESPALRTKAREIISVLGIPCNTSDNSTPIHTGSNDNTTLIHTGSNDNTTLIHTSSNDNNTLIQTEYNDNNTLIQTESNDNNTLIQTEYNDNNTLIQTDEQVITQEVSIIASALISTEPTDSLFEGMLTAQVEGPTLIAGLEEFAIPQRGTSPTGLSDMISLGTSKAPCEFDPLLDMGTPSVTATPVPLTTLNSSILTNYTAPTQQTCSTMIPIQREQPTKTVKTDSFGFISDHIQSLKGSK